MTAFEEILRKALVTSGLDTRGWETVATDLRNRALFSSEVMDARILHEMRTVCSQIAQTTLSESEARRNIRELLASIGYDPGDNSGTIKDLRTKARLDVMIRTNVEQAQGYASHLRAIAPGAMMAFPAYRLVRVEQRRTPRPWNAIWLKAARDVGWEGVCRDYAQMVAMKDSPIWTRISRFGNPFPPFDFNSGMGLQNVKKSVCRELGLLGPDEQPKIPKPPAFNGNLRSSVPFGEDSPEYERLKRIFGDQITLANGEVKWRDGK